MVHLDLRLRRSTVVAAGLSVLVIAGWAVTRATPEISLPRPPGPPPAAATDERVVVGPLQSRTGAWLTVGDAAARVRVRFAPLPGLLYRISTAADAGVAPVVSHRDGRVVVRLRVTGGSGLDELRIVLNRAVRWDLRFPKGAGEQQLNLRDGRVTRVDVGSAGLAELWLPEPDGTVPVTFTGGVGTAMLSLRGGTPVRVRFGEGAGSVQAPWTTNNGTAAGTVLREPGFQQSRDRYAIRAEGGLGALIIRRPPKVLDEKPEPAGPGAAAPGPGQATGGSRDSGRPEPIAPKPERPRPAAPKAERPRPAAPKAKPKPVVPQKKPRPVAPEPVKPKPAKPQREKPRPQQLKPAKPQQEKPRQQQPKAGKPDAGAPKAGVVKPGVTVRERPRSGSSGPAKPLREAPGSGEGRR